MKIKDLLTILSKLPSDREVFVDGYEGGFSDFSVTAEERIAFNVNKESYLGPHDRDDSSERVAVVLRRKDNPNTSE